MDAWPTHMDVGKYTRLEVIIHCNNNPEWQRFRVSLKGLSTKQKLDKLEGWYKRHSKPVEKQILKGTTIMKVEDGARIQIANYLAALRRGGQLDEYNKVKR